MILSCSTRIFSSNRIQMYVVSSQKKESPTSNPLLLDACLPVGRGGGCGRGCSDICSPHLIPPPQGGRRFFLVLLFSTAVLFSVAHSSFSAEPSNENRIPYIVQKMESAVKEMEDYTCEVEQVFFQNGVVDQSYHFKFCFKRKKKIRVDFSRPYSSLTIFYSGDDKEAVVMPFRFIPSFKIRLSIDNPMIKTLAGQRIDRTDMGYFVDFMSKNLKRVRQGEDEFYEDREQVKFLFWAKDYIEEKSNEKYRISISKKHWLPILIERYSLEDKPLEKTEIKNYIINTHLEDKLFVP